MKKIIYIFLYLFLKNFPSHKYINLFRGKIIGMYAKGTKKNLQIGRSVNIANPSNLVFGNDVVINAEVYLIASDKKIIIGNRCLIAPRCFIQTLNHNYELKNVLIAEQGSRSAPINIEDDSWLGYHSVVLPGVTISEGSVIGACSIVTKNTESYGVYVGNPARKIKERI